MANTVAPPAVARGHRFKVGLESGCRPQNISRAAHAGLRCNRAAGKHEGATSHDQKLRLHLDTSLSRKNAIAESAFQGDAATADPWMHPLQAIRLACSSRTWGQRAAMVCGHLLRARCAKLAQFEVVESKRVAGGRVVQRPVLYLGEINSSQELAWRKSIQVLEEGSTRPRTLALFPEDCCEGVLPDASIVRLKLSQLRLERPRQWGACWLALQLWQELRLDRFWGGRPTAGRKGTRWDEVLFVLWPTG